MKFSLKNFSNLQTDKWHTAFYGTKLSMIRSVLDDGHPLTKGNDLLCLRINVFIIDDFLIII